MKSLFWFRLVLSIFKRVISIVIQPVIPIVVDSSGKRLPKRGGGHLPY